MSAIIDYSDVQGIVRYGYGHLPAAGFFLLRIKNPAAARSWLRTAPVTNATAVAPPPQHALQVAFTGDGLEAMGMPRPILEKFSPEFISGMAGEESRSRRLGDIAANAPSQWQWGGAEKMPHLLVMLYAQAGALEHWQEAVQNRSWEEAFTVLRCLPSEALSDTEPFGFKDGISQPQLDWDQTKKLPGDQPEYSNLTALGEFLLGYPNEYGKYSDRPLLPSGDDRSAGLLPAAEDSDQRDLGRNGCYLVLRQLEQDIAGFWRFLDRQTEGNVADQTKLAEAMVGRRMNGEPLVPLSNGQFASADQVDAMKLNGFTYESDSDGTRCPFGAHIRRANPRNGDLPYGTQGWFQWLMRMLGFHRKSFRDDLVSSTRFHRIVRRGRAYGSALSRVQALGGERGRRPRAWALLHLCQRQHRATVRVRAKRLGNGDQVRWPVRRERSIDGEPPADSRLSRHGCLFHPPGVRSATAYPWDAAICHGARRRLFFSPEYSRFMVHRHTGRLK